MVEEHPGAVSLPGIGPERTTESRRLGDGPGEIVSAVGAQRFGPSGMPVYVAAAGVAAAVPVPFLDSKLVALARGAALRRVARRHGVRLTPGARRVLAAPDRPSGLMPSLSRRIVRTVVGRVVSPLGATSRVEQALSTWAAVLLLDHHLAGPTRPKRAPLLEDEATRVRDAVSSAQVRGIVRLIGATPKAVPGAARAVFRAVTAPDSEDRTPAERAVDGVLEVLAEVPVDLQERLCEAFDTALAGAHVSARE